MLAICVWQMVSIKLLLTYLLLVLCSIESVLQINIVIGYSFFDRTNVALCPLYLYPKTVMWNVYLTTDLFWFYLFSQRWQRKLYIIDLVVISQTILFCMLNNLVSVRSCLLVWHFLNLLINWVKPLTTNWYLLEYLLIQPKHLITVNHTILLGKLEHYGIRGVTLSWFRNYLTNRKQYVVIDKYKSDCAQITCGVPQGSILGPLLFLVYINDLNYASKILQTISCLRDDTNLFLTGKSLDALEMQINGELKIILFQNGLKPICSHWILIKHHIWFLEIKSIIILSLLIENSPILRQFETKFLGIILSANLKWSKHIDIVLNKISKSLGIVLKIRQLIPPNLTRMLYLSMVEPYLNYCNLIWASANTSVWLNEVLIVK